MLSLNQEKYKSLTATEKDVLHFIIDNQEYVVNATSRDVASKCNVSKTVVINLSQKIGFEGFNEYRYYLKEQLNNNTIEANSEFSSDILNAIERTIRLNKEEELNEIVDKILATETIYVIGRGSSKYMCSYLTHLLMTLKIKTIVIQDFNHYDVIGQTMNENDLMIAISLSGETTITVNTAKIAAMKKREIISFTAFSNNSLANLANNNVYFFSDNVDTRVHDTISRTTLVFVIELLVNKIKEKMIKEGLSKGSSVTQWLLTKQ